MLSSQSWRRCIFCIFCRSRSISGEGSGEIDFGDASGGGTGPGNGVSGAGFARDLICGPSFKSFANSTVSSNFRNKTSLPGSFASNRR
jgi:hypothetical protein